MTHSTKTMKYVMNNNKMKGLYVSLSEQTEKKIISTKRKKGQTRFQSEVVTYYSTLSPIYRGANKFYSCL